VLFNDKPVKCYTWSTALYGAETGTLRKVDQKYLESFEVWCWRRKEKVSWTDLVTNKYYIESRRKEPLTYNKKRRKANWIGHILHRKCHVKHVIGGKMEG
jgi:hypothetical protein